MRDPAVGRGKDRQYILSTIERLLRIALAYGLEEVELRKGGLRCCVRHSRAIRRGAEEIPEAPPSMPPVEGEAIPPPESAPESEEGLVDVTAPMTGVFYRAPAPGAPPYAEVGDFVEKGQTLCLIEAMKVFNEIPSPVSGVVEEILAQNETLVRQGDVLFRIRPRLAEGEGIA